MDARSVAARLRAEGIDVTVHRDGTLTARMTKPNGGAWGFWLTRHVKEFPGAVVLHTKEWQAADRFFEHAEVLFRLGPAPETVMVGRADSGRAA